MDKEARMFGKSLTDYIAFLRPTLILIAAVWALRLGLSLAGLPISGAQFVSVTGALVLGALYYGWAVGQEGFGSFKQLYGLNLVQGVFSQTLVALAIVLAIVTGQDNIYTTPEFYPPAQGIGVLGLPLPPDGKNLGHAIEHIVVAGAIGFPVIGWMLGSLVLLATRRSPRPASA
jgi:hypothetical protein